MLPASPMSPKCALNIGPHAALRLVPIPSSSLPLPSDELEYSSGLAFAPLDVPTSTVGCDEGIGGRPRSNSQMTHAAAQMSVAVVS